MAAKISEHGGNNLGEEVETMQAARGGEPGESWCLDAQQFAYLKALANLLHKPYTHETIVAVCRALHATLEQYMAVTGSCGELMADGKQRGYWIDRDKITEIKPGWLILYAFTANDIAKTRFRIMWEWRRPHGSAAPSKLRAWKGIPVPMQAVAARRMAMGFTANRGVFALVVGVYATY